MTESSEDFTADADAPPQPAIQVSRPLDVAKVFDLTENRESTRGDLARGLLWLLTFAIGGVLAFIGLGLLDGSVLTQSIFPSLVALAGTALGFYFGSQTAQAEAGRQSDASVRQSASTSSTKADATPPAQNDRQE